MRPVLEPLDRYIATVETSKHRFFQFLDANIRPDNMLVCIGSESAGLLATLSSRLHVSWMLSLGGTLEDRPDTPNPGFSIRFLHWSDPVFAWLP